MSRGVRTTRSGGNGPLIRICKTWQRKASILEKQNKEMYEFVKWVSGMSGMFSEDCDVESIIEDAKKILDKIDEVKP